MTKNNEAMMTENYMIENIKKYYLNDPQLDDFEKVSLLYNKREKLSDKVAALEDSLCIIDSVKGLNNPDGLERAKLDCRAFWVDEYCMRKTESIKEQIAEIEEAVEFIDKNIDAMRAKTRMMA